MAFPQKIYPKPDRLPTHSNPTKHTMTKSTFRRFPHRGNGFKATASLLLLTLLLALGSPTIQAAIVPAAPDIDARGYVLIDYASGHVIAEKKANERMEPASLTKMMSAYIILDELKHKKIGLSDKVLISEKAWRMPGSRTFVEVGKRVDVETLLKGMIIQSGNDATVALAEHVAGDEAVFATMMNQTAAKLGMTGTHFVNSTGLPDPDHYTTARDMVMLARALIHDFPSHYSWYSTKKFTYNGITQYNRNKLLWRDDSVDGLKTGHTDSAGYCLVASAKRDNMRLVSVVLGAKSEDARARESQKLLNYGFRFFESHRLYAPREALTTVRVWKGEAAEVALGLAQEMIITIPRGEYDNLQATMKIQPNITAPVNKGASYGSVVVSLDGDVIAEAPLIALGDVAEGGLFQSLKDEILLMFE